MGTHNHCDDSCDNDIHGHSNFHGKHTADGLAVPEGTPIEFTDGPGHHCHTLPEPKHSCYSKPCKETTTVYHTQDKHNHEATRHRPYKHQYRHMPSYHHHHRPEHNESIYNLVECLIKEKTNDLDHNLFQMHQSIAEYNNRFMDIFNEVARNTANGTRAQDSLQSINKEIERLIASNSEVTTSNTVLKNKVDAVSLGLSEVKLDYKSAIQDSKLDYIGRINDLEDDLEDQLSELRRDYVLADTNLQTSLLAAIDNLETLNQINLDNLKNTIDCKINDAIHDLESELGDKINDKAIKSVTKEDNIVTINLNDGTKFNFETQEAEQEEVLEEEIPEEEQQIDKHITEIRISNNGDYLDLVLVDNTKVSIAKSELVNWLNIPDITIVENKISNLENQVSLLVNKLNVITNRVIQLESIPYPDPDIVTPPVSSDEYVFFGKFTYPVNSETNNTLNSAEVGFKIINSTDSDKKVPEGAEIHWSVNAIFDDENLGSYLVNSNMGTFNMPASGIREINYIRDPLNTHGRTSGRIDLTAYYIDNNGNKHHMIGLTSGSNSIALLNSVPFSNEAIAQGQGIVVPVSITYNV